MARPSRPVCQLNISYACTAEGNTHSAALSKKRRDRGSHLPMSCTLAILVLHADSFTTLVLTEMPADDDNNRQYPGTSGGDVSLGLARNAPQIRRSLVMFPSGPIARLSLTYEIYGPFGACPISWGRLAHDSIYSVTSASCHYAKTNQSGMCGSPTSAPNNIPV